MIFRWFWFQVDRCCKLHLWMLLIPFCNKKCTVVQRQSTVELDCFLPFRPSSGHIYNDMSLCYNTLTDCDARHLDNVDTCCLTFILICLISRKRLVNFEYAFWIYSITSAWCEGIIQDFSDGKNLITIRRTCNSGVSSDDMAERCLPKAPCAWSHAWRILPEGRRSPVPKLHRR